MFFVFFVPICKTFLMTIVNNSIKIDKLFVIFQQANNPAGVNYFEILIVLHRLLAAA